MLTLLLAVVQAPAVAPLDTIPMLWTPHRVYDTRAKEFADFEQLAAKASRADVVFFGEQHDDVATHRMQRALLESIGRRRGDVVLALEMFERDVQPHLDSYLAGATTEDAFLKLARPWPNYARDYRPLVEYAKSRGWKVVAGNVPRPMAGSVAKQGLVAISQLADSTRPWAAAAFECPLDDDYFERFAKVMGGHAAPGLDAATTTRQYYEAQCVKDETMAESVVRARSAAGGAPLVIHVNGSFHSDFGDGTAERVRRRLPDARIIVITGVPVHDLDAADAKSERKKGDWIVFTIQPPAKTPSSTAAAPPR